MYRIHFWEIQTTEYSYNYGEPDSRERETSSCLRVVSISINSIFQRKKKKKRKQKNGITHSQYSYSCGAISGNNPKHLEVARDMAYEFHKNKVQLVYGGGTSGIMGELARTLVNLSGPQAVHGVIPRALVRVEQGYDNTKEQPHPNQSSQSSLSSNSNSNYHINNDNASNASPSSSPFTTASASAAGKAHERILPNPMNASGMIKESNYGATTIVPDMHTRKRLMATKVLEGGPGSGFVSLAGGFGTMEEVMEMTTWNQLGIHRVGVILLNFNGYWDGVLAWVKNAVKEGFISPQNANILVEARNVDEVLPKLKDYKVSSGRMQLNWGEE